VACDAVAALFDFFMVGASVRLTVEHPVARRGETTNVRTPVHKMFLQVAACEAEAAATFITLVVKSFLETRDVFSLAHCAGQHGGSPLLHAAYLLISKLWIVQCQQDPSRTSCVLFTARRTTRS
jgi:hypothetical protein